MPSPPEAPIDDVTQAWDLAKAHLASSDQEISRAIARVDQNYTYMFTVTAAFITAQLALKDVYATFNHNPADFLLVGLLGLWFPANHAIHSMDLLVAGLWRRETLLPTVSALADEVAKNISNPALRDAANAVDALDWETYRHEHLFQGAPTFGVMNLLWLLKGAWLYLPSFAALGKYASVRSSAASHGVTELEIALLCVFGVVFGVVTAANLRLGNLPYVYRSTARGKA